jgi:hypothetical protein
MGYSAAETQMCEFDALCPSSYQHFFWLEITGIFHVFACATELE